MGWNWPLVSSSNKLIPRNTGLIPTQWIILMMPWIIGIKNLLVYWDGRENLVVSKYFWKCQISLISISPWVGHLGSVYNIFVGLKKNLNSKMVTDHRWHEIDDKKLYKAECKNLYGNFKDEIPINRPSEWGIHVKISIFGDYKHTGNLSTCSFHNGLFFFIKSYFINWYSKGQVDD